MGRFVSPDSYAGNPANPASLNRYSYVQNNPCKYTDATGHCPMCIGAAIGAVAGGIGTRQAILFGIGAGGIAGSGVGALVEAATGAGAVAGAAGGGVVGGVGGAIASYAENHEVRLSYVLGGAATGALLGSGIGLIAEGMAATGTVALSNEAIAATLAGGGGAAVAAEGNALTSAGQALMRAEPAASALKDDLFHRAATFMREMAARTGTNFEISGADGAKSTLTQVGGDLNGQAGRYEYIVNSAGELTHQMFVPGGNINGVPIMP